jgi:hypothetical protein
VVDRLTFNAHIIQTGTNSYRLTSTRNKKGAANTETDPRVGPNQASTLGAKSTCHSQPGQAGHSGPGRTAQQRRRFSLGEPQVAGPQLGDPAAARTRLSRSGGSERAARTRWSPGGR